MVTEKKVKETQVSKTVFSRLKEICEFLGNELGHIVRDNFFWQSISRKPHSHLINRPLRSVGSHICHLYSLGMAVNQPKKIIAIFFLKQFV